MPRVTYIGQRDAGDRMVHDYEDDKGVRFSVPTEIANPPTLGQVSRGEVAVKRSANIEDRRAENELGVDRSDTLLRNLPATPQQMVDYKRRLLADENYKRSMQGAEPMPMPSDIRPASASNAVSELRARLGLK